MDEESQRFVNGLRYGKRKEKVVAGKARELFYLLWAHWKLPESSDTSDKPNVREAPGINAHLLNSPRKSSGHPA